MPESASSSAPSSDTAVVRLVALHFAIIAVPIVVLALLLQLWVLAIPLAIIVGAAVTAVRLRGIDDRITRAVGAHPVGAAEEPRLAGLVEAVAMASGVAVPRLFVIDTASVNAVSWGVSGPGCLAVTRGLLDTADPVSLEAVVGHQLAHRRSVDVTTLAAALFGPLARGPFTAFVVDLVQGDEERSVVLADLDGVRATQYPPGLVAMLEMLRAQPSTLDGVPAALTGLCFADPHGGEGAFSVHPPLDDRIDLLREI